VVPRRPYEREALLLDRAQRAAGGEQRRFPGRCIGVRVGEEPGLGLDRLDRVQVFGGMNALDRLPGRELPFDPPRKGLVQPGEPRGILFMEVALGRVQLRQRRVADQIDDEASSNLPASPFIPSPRACSAAAFQSGSTSGNGGSGAERSSVAISR